MESDGNKNVKNLVDRALQAPLEMPVMFFFLLFCFGELKALLKVIHFICAFNKYVFFNTPDRRVCKTVEILFSISNKMWEYMFQM